MKVYYNQKKISSSLRKFFINIFALSIPHLKNLVFIITGIIVAESIVTSDFSRKLKDDFSFVQLESIERRFRRFFASFSNIAYSFYDAFIRYIISKFKVKHADKSTSKTYSFFNLGLTIFNLCYYNYVDFSLKFTFVLYDV